MGYRNALVFFIDILGSQNRTDFDELLDINETFHKGLQQNQNNDKNHPHTVYKRTIFTFSDCAYIIYDFKDGIEESRKDLPQLFDIALRNTEPLLVEFLKKGFLCRGGIAYGEVYYESERSLFFGPAINRAHNYEEKIARFPRIIMDEEIATKVIALNEDRINCMPTVCAAKLAKAVNGDIVLKDNDGQYYLHYLNMCSLGMNRFDFLAIHEFWKDRIFNEIIKQRSEMIRLQKKSGQCADKEDQEAYNYKISRCQNIIEKYVWLNNYLVHSFPTDEDHGLSCHFYERE